MKKATSINNMLKYKKCVQNNKILLLVPTRQLNTKKITKVTMHVHTHVLTRLCKINCIPAFLCLWCDFFLKWAAWG